MSDRRSHIRLVRKLEESLGEEICMALADPTVVEIMLNPDGRLFIERLGQGMSQTGTMPAGAAEIV
ncbi:MAG: conjugal transfer protein TrbB, partial [Mesorhizobium sp.]|nr:conjugal transfer protein TrbB [Mesorhizobium sp.]